MINGCQVDNMLAMTYFKNFMLSWQNAHRFNMDGTKLKFSLLVLTNDIDCMNIQVLCY